MAWQAHPGVVPLLLGSGLLWLNAMYLLRHQSAGQRAPGQLLAVGLIASLATSVGSFALEQATVTKGAKVFWNKMQYLGDAPLMAFLFAFALVYVGYDLSKKHFAALFAVPALILGGVFTNGVHNLYWTSVSLGTVQGYIILDNHPGPLFYLYIVFVYVVLLAALILLVRAAVDSEAAHRRHLTALALGTLVPGVAGIAYVLEVGPTPTPNYPGYAYLVTAATITYSIQRHDVFSVLPVARRTIIDQMEDGVLTIDNRGIVVDVNAAAATYLEAEATDIRGQSFSDVLGDTGVSITLDAKESQTALVEMAGRMFDVSVQPLVRSNSTVGQLVVLRDVTYWHRRQEKLEEISKMTHHDIRNEVTVLLERAERIGSGREDNQLPSDGLLHEELVNHLTNIKKAGERIADLTDAAQMHMDAISQLMADPQGVPLAPTLQREVATATTIDADATVRLDTDVPDVAVQADEMLDSVFRNLLTNAIRHNDGPNPEVVISVRRSDDSVQVTIADNGPGIPEDQRAAVVKKGVTLEDSDGTGYGLSLVASLTEQYGGSLTIGEADLGGAAVTVTLPVVTADPGELSAQREPAQPHHSD